MKDIKWAVLGTGVIANEMAVALKRMAGTFMRLVTGRMTKRWHLLRSMA